MDCQALASIARSRDCRLARWVVIGRGLFD
jgi:hypothetical protein